MRHAADRFGQHLGDGQLADLAAGDRGVAQRNRIRDHQFVHFRVHDVVDRGAGQDRVHAVGHDTLCAVLLERAGGRAQGARGVDLGVVAVVVGLIVALLDGFDAVGLVDRGCRSTSTTDAQPDGGQGA